MCPSSIRSLPGAPHCSWWRKTPAGHPVMPFRQLPGVAHALRSTVLECPCLHIVPRTVPSAEVTSCGLCTITLATSSFSIHHKLLLFRIFPVNTISRSQVGLHISSVCPYICVYVLPITLHCISLCMWFPVYNVGLFKASIIHTCIHT